MSYKDPITEAYEAILMEDILLEQQEYLTGQMGIPKHVHDFLFHLSAPIC